MIRALTTAATGMQAQENRVDVIANNLSNVNTTGFKKSRNEFEDLVYETLRPAGVQSAAGTGTPAGIQVGRGVRTVATLREHSLGAFKETGNSLDLAIEGDGFFRVRQANGEIGYTRAGAFRTDAQGRLVTAGGLEVEPGIVLPADTRHVAVSADGAVSVVRTGDTQAVEVGRMDLAMFVNPAGLESMGHNLFTATPASGEAIITQPGQGAAGTLLSGALEMSNVKVVEEMVDLITSQRAYETNSKVIRAADEMLQSTANLR